eukprot:TRINITY_DN67118_c10_g1_i2.p1 TRINITY_DN67118_c10_g1~~TRINITY_DN67118_c10_g1_i2.p1  ORF type:complete len:125 (-),score=1.29 TRINITY_DN67118_c10_g1_i2:672-1046(-)
MNPPHPQLHMTNCKNIRCEKPTDASAWCIDGVWFPSGNLMCPAVVPAPVPPPVVPAVLEHGSDLSDLPLLLQADLVVVNILALLGVIGGMVWGCPHFCKKIRKSSRTRQQRLVQQQNSGNDDDL